MSTLKIIEQTLPSADLGCESTLPSISVKLALSDVSSRTHLDEDDGLFVNYGLLRTVYPYKAQDNYGRKLTPKSYKTVVLENEYLKATFFPDFGGKLWSLIDKKENKELLFSNSVVRPCNLGVRNAWLSGGIEWNSCFLGHSPFTCSLINTAETKLEDGTPVLRFYYFERIRMAVIQMDCFLPDGAKTLYIRTRITNPNNFVIPMYWWSNVAAVQKDGDRVIVPATESYTVNSDTEVIKIGIPEYNDINVTYPKNNIAANDFFWKNDLNKRGYIAQLDKNGYGLFETSTARLQGRKLFVWGDSQGGSKWMNFLTADNESGEYDEIQCGLARTQYESLPMPPNTVWEWLEVYGALKADKEKVHGQWDMARDAVERGIYEIIPQDHLDKMLNDTRAMAKSPANILFRMNDGWGALELERKQKGSLGLMNPHLDFGDLKDEQKVWVELLNNGTVGNHDPLDVPLSYMCQKEWIDLLETAIKGKDSDNWYAYYLLGTAKCAEADFIGAQDLLVKSLSFKESPWAYYALAITEDRLGNSENGEKYLIKAYSLRDNDLSIAKELFRNLYEKKRSALTIDLFEKAHDHIKSNERCLLYYAYALAREGRLDEAENILCGKDGKTFMVVPDTRECELTITQLWVYINEKRGLTREQMGEPPYDLDFRMFAKREGWI